MLVRQQSTDIAGSRCCLQRPQCLGCQSMYLSLHVQLRVLAISMGLTAGQMLCWQLSAQSFGLHVTVANTHIHMHYIINITYC